MRSTLAAAWRAGTIVGACLLACTPPAWSAEAGAVGVGATVESKNNCLFNAKVLTLGFGNIDPAGSADVTATATMTFVCNGAGTLATFFISANDGLHASGAGARRMRHTVTTSEYLPYSISLAPATATVAKGSTQTLTVTGTIQPFQFQNVLAGVYQDTVVLTITP